MQSIRRMETPRKYMYRPLVRAEQIWSCCITIFVHFRQLELFWSDNVPKYMPSCPMVGPRDWPSPPSSSTMCRLFFFSFNIISFFHPVCAVTAWCCYLLLLAVCSRH
ncbi:hypothetical protein HDV62DRAFT_351232 [Trichoderma sp. SZMC 28011]